VVRGYVKGSVDVTAAGGGGVSVDEARARRLLTALRSLARRLGLRDNLAAADLLRLPDLIVVQAQPSDPQRLWEPIARATAQALDSLNAMRRREGRALARDLRQRLAALRRLSRAIGRRAPCVLAACRRALAARVRALSAPHAPDAAMLARELAHIAERCDISEELTRLESHFSQADTFLSGAAPCGRSMDFLCQEMLREINTAGAKANDAAITRMVIRFKTGLEAVREQVQNVE